LGKYKAYKTSKTSGTVSCQVNNFTQQQILKNRDVLKSLIRMVLYCACQDISLREQSYDGASVMSGCNNGVQSKFREFSKNACPYVHCYAHRLNLVLVDTAKKVEAFDEIIRLLDAICAFQSFSTIRHNAFIQAQKGCGKNIEVPRHCETRWVFKYKGVHFFKSKFKCVIDALTECFKISKQKKKPLMRPVLFYINFLHFM